MQGKSPLTHGFKKNGTPPYNNKKREKRNKKKKNGKESCGIKYKRNGLSKQFIESE